MSNTKLSGLQVPTVPDPMRLYRQFVVWRLEPDPARPNKPRKVPYNAATGLRASSTDPTTWVDCDAALAAYAAQPDAWAGIGFVFSEDDPFVFVDLDDCRDPSTGAYSDHARQIVAALPGAWEVSQSGTGLHGVGLADGARLAGKRRKWTDDAGRKHEVYCTDRFMAIGGRGWSGEPSTDWTDSLAAWVPDAGPANDTSTCEWIDAPRPDYSGPVDDDELIAAARASRGLSGFGNTASFEQLWSADAALGRFFPDDGGQGRTFDHSGADMALCNALAWWTGCNPVRMLRLFKRSALWREDERKARMAIAKAVADPNRKYMRGKADDSASRSMDDLLNDAARLAQDDAAGIATLAGEAGKLGPVECDVVLRAINTATGVGLTPLRAQAKEAKRETEPDHLTLALAAQERLGAENVIHAEQFFWRWSARGVWDRVPDIDIKQAVQESIAGAGIAVSDARVTGTTNVLRNHLYRSDHEFNRNTAETRHTVNTLSGELDLTPEGWRLRPHRRERYLTTQIPVAYDPKATAPQFGRFLEDVFRDDDDKVSKIAALLEMMGYSLMPYADHDRFAFLHGNSGANGKSVTLSVVENLVGRKNVAGVQPAYFEDQHHCAHLDGKLVNIVTDLEANKPLAAGAAKRIGSGELMTVAHKHRDPFDIRPFVTCWTGTNHLPKVFDRSGGFWRRALVITFNRAFAPHEQDRDLRGKLATELPGILNLALGHYASALRNGWTNPASSVEAVRVWRAANDPVAAFVEQECTLWPGASVPSSQLYERYVDWSRDTGHSPMSQTSFSPKITEIDGVRSVKASTIQFSGITLRPQVRGRDGTVRG